ncbi:MAG TPA: chloride channel protein [Candidatus Saccharimonadales bacterium]|nr:chloride channel protein [Candidatus Saccharimonadales bacterium]
MVRLLKLLAVALLTGIGVAITYYVFEAAAHNAIDALWLNWIDTDQHRLLVVPMCLLLALMYFGAQHALDRTSERQESHGLGDAPKPTIANFSKILFLGFLSLLAGASLGPEAILVPACTLLGAYIGSRFFGNSSQSTKLMGAAGLVALFAAFFNSFIIGMLGLLLIRKQTKLQLRPVLIAISAVAAGSTIWLLGVLSSKPYVSLPPTNWYFNFRSLLGLIILLVAGYAITYVTGWLHRAASILHAAVLKRPWWLRALVAAAGLAALYLAGGHLVEFTGNKSIVPMLQQAAALGTDGLLWVVLVKIAAIGWSKAMGYRGGMIFPTIFVASTLVAIMHSHVPNLNFIYGLIAVLIGALFADRKVKILL